MAELLSDEIYWNPPFIKMPWLCQIPDIKPPNETRSNSSITATWHISEPVWPNSDANPQLCHYGSYDFRNCHYGVCPIRHSHVASSTPKNPPSAHRAHRRRMPQPFPFAGQGFFGLWVEGWILHLAAESCKPLGGAPEQRAKKMIDFFICLRYKYCVCIYIYYM